MPPPPRHTHAHTRTHTHTRTHSRTHTHTHSRTHARMQGSQREKTPVMWNATKDNSTDKKEKREGEKAEKGGKEWAWKTCVLTFTCAVQVFPTFRHEFCFLIDTIFFDFVSFSVFPYPLVLWSSSPLLCFSASLLLCYSATLLLCYSATLQFHLFTCTALLYVVTVCCSSATHLIAASDFGSLRARASISILCNDAISRPVDSVTKRMV